MASTEERNRILRLVESGQVSAEQAAGLMDALNDQPERPTNRRQGQKLRVRVIDTAANRQKINVTVPVNLVPVGLKLGARFAPQFSGSALEDLLRAIEGGATGTLLELQDMEEGERIEISVE
jgi:hypothetical protein